MEITEVRIKLMEDNSAASNERLQAFCSITSRTTCSSSATLKIIEGAKAFCGHAGRGS